MMKETKFLIRTAMKLRVFLTNIENLRSISKEKELRMRKITLSNLKI